MNKYFYVHFRINLRTHFKQNTNLFKVGLWSTDSCWMYEVCMPYWNIQVKEKIENLTNPIG